MLAEGIAQQQVLSKYPPEVAQNPQAMPMIQAEIERAAAQIIAQLTEQFTQSVTPAQQQDPLVMIRQQELAIKEQQIQQNAQESAMKMAADADKERNKVLIAQQRIDQQDEATQERANVARERIEAQKDIAMMNARMRGARQ